MDKRVYHYFPQRVDFEQRYNYRGDLPFLVKTLAGMDEKFGMFITDSPDPRGRPIQAKRKIRVEIADKKVDFVPLNSKTLDSIIGDIESSGILDFRVTLEYSYLDEKYSRVPFKGDVYLVRSDLKDEILKLSVHHIEGLGRTDSSRIADTIVDELQRNAAR